MNTETPKSEVKPRPLSRYAAHAGETETWIDVAAPSCTEAEKLHAVYSAAPELLAEAQAELHWIENLIGDIRAGRPLKPARIEEGLILRRDSLRETIAKAKGQ